MGKEYGGSEYNPLLWNENDIIENIQAIILFINVLVIIRLLKIKNKNKTINVFLILNLVCVAYVFFEEISWGQHYLKFSAPTILVEENSILFNKQSEFNLHNISNLFNEVPRALVLIWFCLSIPLLRIFNYSRSKNINLIIEPNKNLINLSSTILLIITPELIIDFLNLYDSFKLIIYKDIYFYKYDFYQLSLNILSFNFIRFSEFQEVLFYYYFLRHSLLLKEKILIKYNHY